MPGEQGVREAPQGNGGVGAEVETEVASTGGGDTVAERLVWLLATAGVDVVFGIGGTHSLHLLGALERAGGPRFVAARNEQGAAYMATGYARATRRPGVVLTSTGPGALNALSGLADARWSSLPLLHVTTFADDGVFSGGIHESPAQTDVMGQVGVASFRVEGEDVDRPFWLAWQRCRGPVSGPVTLEVNARAWNAHPRRSPVPAGVAIGTGTNDGPGCEPADVAADDLGPLVEAAASATAPVIYAGGGVLRAGAAAEVLRLAEHLGAPVVTSFQGKAIADWSHPLYLGPWGTESAVRDLVGACDLGIVLGSKLSALSTGHWGLSLPERTFLVDPAVAAHGQYPGLALLRAGVRPTCERLVTEVPARPAAADAAAGRVEAVARSVWAGVRDSAPREWEVIDALGRALPPDAAVALDMNKASFWAMKYLWHAEPGVHSFSSYLCMGSALPAAIGMAEAGRSAVVALVGDGGLQMSLAELATLAERGSAVAVVVFVDGAYGLLRDNGQAEGVRGSRELGVTIRNPDYAELARAFDIDHTRATNGRDLADRAVGVGRPTVVEVPAEFSRFW